MFEMQGTGCARSVSLRMGINSYVSFFFFPLILLEQVPVEIIRSTQAFALDKPIITAFVITGSLLQRLLRPQMARLRKSPSGPFLSSPIQTPSIISRYFPTHRHDPCRASSGATSSSTSQPSSSSPGSICTACGTQNGGSARAGREKAPRWSVPMPMATARVLGGEGRFEFCFALLLSSRCFTIDIGSV